MSGGKRGVAHLDARAYTPMDMSWRDQAACLGSDTNAFFHSEGTRGVARERFASDARRVCRTCPVAIACIVDAIRVGDRYGVRGGLDLEDGDDFRRARKIARKNGVEA